MSAVVIILPVIRVERFDEPGQTVLVTVSKADWRRLAMRASRWNVSPEQAASDILSDALRPRTARKRRKEP